MKQNVFLSFLLFFFLTSISIAQKSKQLSNDDFASNNNPKRVTLNGSNITSVKLGEQQINLVAPEEYIEPRIDIPLFRELMIVPANMELLAVFMPSNFVEKVKGNQDVELSDYTLIETLRSEKDKIILRNTFEKAKMEYRQISTEGFLKNQDAANRLLKGGNEFFSKKLGQEFRFELTGGISLGVLEEGKDYITMGVTLNSNTQLGSNTEKTVQVCVFSVLFLKGKGILVYTYKPYKSSQDINTTKEINKKFINLLFSNNL